MSGPCTTPSSIARPHLHLGDAIRELGGEGIVDAVLHQDAVRADAGLAHIAELGGNRAFDRLVEIGIVENDERRIAAKFERNLLHRGRGLLHQNLAHAGRSGEGDRAHERVRGQLLADGLRIARYDVQNAIGKACLLQPAPPAPEPSAAYPAQA